MLEVFRGAIALIDEIDWADTSGLSGTYEPVSLIRLRFVVQSKGGAD